MRESFDKQLSQINIELLQMAAKIEEIIAVSVKSVEERDVGLSKRAVLLDNQINDCEKRVESLCLKLLLQYQPVFADDLRRVSAVLKMVTDMERIGDQASDIAELNIHAASQGEYLNIDDISEMARKTARMVSESINAYINRDEELAQTIIASDSDVDDLFIKIKKELIDMISEDKSCGERALDTIMAAKYFERIGDHAVNIAGWVIFAITGEHKNTRII